MEKIKAGYVSFGTIFYEPSRLKMISSGAEKQLREAGLELVSTDPVYGEGTNRREPYVETYNQKNGFPVCKHHQLDRHPWCIQGSPCVSD